MLLFLLFVFTIIPVTELFLLIEVGRWIGTWNTIFLVLFTGVIGAYAAQFQGRSLLRRLHLQLQKGEIPTQALLHGGLVFLGGVFLVAPGLITDALGLCMILPFSRPIFAKGLLMLFQNGIQVRVRTHNKDDFDLWEADKPKPKPLKADVIRLDSFKKQDRP